MPDTRKRDPSRSGDLAQAAAVITQLVQLDCEAESLIRQAEETAAQNLESVAKAILTFEQEAADELAIRLNQHRQTQEEISSLSLQDAYQRYKRAHQLLSDHYEQQKDALANSLVERVLKI